MKKKLLLICAVSTLIALPGCAGYKQNDDGSYYSWGFLRTMTVKQEFYESGATKSKEIATQSNTSDVLVGANELLKTGVDYASKVKP